MFYIYIIMQKPKNVKGNGPEKVNFPVRFAHLYMLLTKFCYIFESY